MWDRAPRDLIPDRIEALGTRAGGIESLGCRSQVGSDPPGVDPRWDRLPRVSLPDAIESLGVRSQMGLNRQGSDPRWDRAPPVKRRSRLAGTYPGHVLRHGHGPRDGEPEVAQGLCGLRWPIHGRLERMRYSVPSGASGLPAVPCDGKEQEDPDNVVQREHRWRCLSGGSGVPWCGDVRVLEAQHPTHERERRHSRESAATSEASHFSSCVRIVFVPPHVFAGQRQLMVGTIEGVPGLADPAPALGV